MENQHSAPEHPRSSLWVTPRWAGLAVAALFWWESLVPTLIPRPAVAQGLVSAVCVAAGYGIGVAISWGVSALYRGRPLKEAVLRGLWIAVAVVWLAVVIVGLPLWLVWQNDQRDLMGWVVWARPRRGSRSSSP